MYSSSLRATNVFIHSSLAHDCYGLGVQTLIGRFVQEAQQLKLLRLILPQAVISLRAGKPYICVCPGVASCYPRFTVHLCNSALRSVSLPRDQQLTG